MTINAGDSVTFTNKAGTHNAVCQDPDPTCGFKTLTAAPWGATTTFNIPGVFRVRCTHHSSSFTSGMVGSVTVKAVANASPTVTLTNPPPSAVFTAPADIVLGANASDSDGSVNHVDFFQDGIKIGTDSAAPYAATATGIGAGNHTFSAVATDDKGATATNTIAVNVSAHVNLRPTVTLTNPPPSTVFTAPADIALGASASDSDGSVSQVEFFQDGVRIGVDLTAPYEAAVTALGAGNYLFAAVTTDNTGATATNTIAVSVNQPAGPITLSNPAVVNGEFHVTVNGTLVGTSYELQGSTSLMDGFTGPAAATFNGAATPIPLVVPVGVSGVPKYYRVRAK